MKKPQTQTIIHMDQGNNRNKNPDNSVNFKILGMARNSH